MQYGTNKGEGIGALSADATEGATDAERDSRTLDYLITVIGFGLCRAWIVFCLGAPLIAGAASSFHVGLSSVRRAGALATCSFRGEIAAPASAGASCASRCSASRPSPLRPAASVILALDGAARPLAVVGFVVGGLGAGHSRCCGRPFRAPRHVLRHDRLPRRGHRHRPRGRHVERPHEPHRLRGDPRCCRSACFCSRRTAPGCRGATSPRSR